MKIRNAFIAILLAGVIFASCEAKLAKGSETEILTFKFEEYPDQKVILTTEGIVSQMPLEIEDLRMTPIFTVSRGAIAEPPSGEKQDFGTTVKIGVTSEDNYYYALYEVNVNYPASSADFKDLSVGANTHTYGTDFKLDFLSFNSKATDSGMLKFSSFAQSSHAPLTDGGASLADKTDLQFYPNAAQKGKTIVVATSYDLENAATIKFSRPVDVDTVTFTPSMLMAQAMKQGFKDPSQGIDIPAMSSNNSDYLKLCFVGYDAKGEMVAEKEFNVANFTYAPNTYIREGKQYLTLLTSKIRNIKSLKIYFKSNRNDIPPVFFIDAMSYKVRPQVTIDE